MNVLTALNCYLDSRQKLTELHVDIIRSPAVIRVELKPTLKAVTKYLSWLQVGVEYARDMWGEECLPRYLGFFERKLGTGSSAVSNFIVYHYNNGSDYLAISYLHIAERCQSLQSAKAIGDKHLGPNCGVRTQHFILLQAIEECYHCRQVRQYLKRGGRIADLINQYGPDIQHDSSG